MIAQCRSPRQSAKPHQVNRLCHTIAAHLRADDPSLDQIARDAARFERAGVGDRAGSGIDDQRVRARVLYRPAERPGRGADSSFGDHIRLHQPYSRASGETRARCYTAIGFDSG